MRKISTILFILLLFTSLCYAQQAYEQVTAKSPRNVDWFPEIFTTQEELFRNWGVWGNGFRQYSTKYGVFVETGWYYRDMTNGDVYASRYGNGEPRFMYFQIDVINGRIFNIKVY